MNPVKAEICLREQDYIYSSYKDYLKKENFINSKILNLVFQTPKEYLEKFKSIRYQTMDIENETVNLKDILTEYISNHNLIYNKRKIPENFITNFIEYLEQQEYTYTKTDLAKVLNISRAKLYRILNKKI